MLHTFQTVHDLIQNAWESEAPDRVLQALRQFEGKAVTSRILAKLPGGAEAWRLVKHYGWTSLESKDYGQKEGGLSLMLYRSEASLPLDTNWVERENPAYFAGRRERNHARMEAMNTKATLDAMAEAMNAAEAAIEALYRADLDVQVLTNYGKPLNADSYTIRRACGLSDPTGQPLINRDYKGRS